MRTNVLGESVQGSRVLARIVASNLRLERYIKYGETHVHDDPRKHHRFSAGRTTPRSDFSALMTTPEERAILAAIDQDARWAQPLRLEEQQAVA